MIANLPQIAALIETIYPGLDLTQPSAVLQLTFFSFGSFIIGLPGATFLAGWAGDEGRRRLEVVLSTPRSRASWAFRSGLGVLARDRRRDAGHRRPHRRSRSSSRAATSSTPVAGIGILGLAAAAFAGVGLAVGGLVRSSLAAGVTGVLIIATLLLDTLGAALKLPQWVLDLSIYKHLGQPMAGIFDPVGIVVATVMVVGGLAVCTCRPHAARHRQVTSGGGTLGHRARRRVGRAAPRLERPAQDGRRPAPGGDDRDAGGVGRHRAARDRGLVGAGPGPRCRSRGSSLGVASGVVEAAYFILLSAAYRRGDLSVVYPLARGTAPLLAVFIGVVVLGERLGVAGLDRGRRCCWSGSSSSSDRGGPSRWPGAASAEARKAAADSAILFALATGVMIATYTAIDRVGTRQIDPFPYAAILWVTCSVVLVAVGRGSWPAATCCATGRRRRAGPRSAAG